MLNIYFSIYLISETSKNKLGITLKQINFPFQSCFVEQRIALPTNIEPSVYPP